MTTEGDRPSESEVAPRGAVMNWFEERMQAATIVVEEQPIGALRGWSITDAHGMQNAIENLDQEGRPRFFRTVGRTIYTSGREVPGFDQPGIEEIGDPNDPDYAVGTVGLLVDRESGDVLVTAAAEPFQAAPGEAPGAFLAIRASVQGSYTNIASGKVPFSGLVDQSTYTHVVSSSNGGRIQGKIRVGITPVDRGSVDLGDQPNARWFTKTEIDEGIVNGAPFNPLFHTAYSLLKAREAVSSRPPRR